MHRALIISIIMKYKNDQVLGWNNMPVAFFLMVSCVKNVL